MTHVVYSEQYRRPCVVASPTDTADAVITACRANGATIVSQRCELPEHGHETEYVVQLRDDVGPELWTGAALRRSLGKTAAP